MEGENIVALRRSRDHSFEEFVEHEGERTGRRTVSIDPERLDAYLERQSYRAWAEDQDNEDPWYLR